MEKKKARDDDESKAPLGWAPHERVGALLEQARALLASDRADDGHALFVRAQRRAEREAAEVFESEALLAELLSAFGLRGSFDVGASTEARRSKALYGVPAEDHSIARYVAERVTMLPTLRDLVGQVRALRSRLNPLPQPGNYDEQRDAIITRWNTELRAIGATELAPLCEVCGLPAVLRRRSRKPGGEWATPTVCSDSCAKIRKTRTQSVRRQLRG